ncbi:hypothetical protein HAX54_008309 [Datura stramonium]|uniref:Uncharacterized protein n=1 Tax=Datura stramonium TaxID=4076 RepID=A0ABS8TD20_DATST|nr:hypothetical protein [Datura stramonium]
MAETLAHRSFELEMLNNEREVVSKKRDNHQGDSLHWSNNAEILCSGDDSNGEALPLGGKAFHVILADLFWTSLFTILSMGPEYVLLYLEYKGGKELERSFLVTGVVSFEETVSRPRCFIFLSDCHVIPLRYCS